MWLARRRSRAVGSENDAAPPGREAALRQALLRDPDAKIRRGATQGLLAIARAGPITPATRSALKSSLKDDNADVRYWAKFTLDVLAAAARAP